MPYLICYDISKDSLRARLGKEILKYGLDRINKSVYLGSANKSSLTKLENWIAQEIASKGDPQDSCIIIAVDKEQVQRMRIYGIRNFDPEELSGEKSTLIL
ncbi:MAG: CRISPR-associated endonuclease Cas2 [Bacteroidota bacterium]